MIGNFGSVNTDLLNHKELSKIRLFIEECLKDYLTLTINPIDGNEFYITQSWANVTAPKQHHHGHVHQNSIVSGVLYISAEDGIAICLLIIEITDIKQLNRLKNRIIKKNLFKIERRKLLYEQK